MSKPFFTCLSQGTSPLGLWINDRLFNKLNTLFRGLFSKLNTLFRQVPIVHAIAYFCPFRNGMFTTSQLSNFSLLLHYLSTTQTLFGDNLPLLSLDGCSAVGSEDSLNTEGCIVSLFQFHQSFIDYCVRLRLVNLLYHYLDFYGLVQSNIIH